jgi:hypothetical protein
MMGEPLNAPMPATAWRIAAKWMVAKLVESWITMPYQVLGELLL